MLVGLPLELWASIVSKNSRFLRLTWQPVRDTLNSFRSSIKNMTLSHFCGATSYEPLK